MKKERSMKKIEDLLRRLHNGEDVPVRNIENALKGAFGESGKSRYDDAWENEGSYRKSLTEYSPELKEYDDLLKKARMLDNRAEGINIKKASKGFKSNGQRAIEMGRKAEAAYERALERLEELLRADPSLRTYLDREVDFDTHGRSPSPDFDSVPRIKTSRSRENQLGLPPKRKKREVKIDVLESALEELSGDCRTMSEEAARRMKKLQDSIKR